MRARGLGAVAVVVALAASPASHAQGETESGALSAEETDALEHGETVTRPQLVERGNERLVGGVTYSIVEATPAELEAVLDSVPSYGAILPYTKSATLLARIDDDFLVTLRQGNALVDAGYTIRVRKDPRAGEVRFWLDRARPHDIVDAWGFFRVQPLPEGRSGVPRSLVTYGILVDIGPGLVRSLFEPKIRRVVLTVPDRLRRYVAGMATARASR
jgi:hypothetical protein